MLNTETAAFEWAVALPDVEISGALGAYLPRELVIDRKDQPRRRGRFCT